MSRYTNLRPAGWILAGLLIAAGVATGNAVAGSGPEEQPGMLRVVVRVDGLSCPFCAYGLEKKLRKVDGVAGVEIRVDAGEAELTPAAGTVIDLAQVAEAVRDGGFTPRGIVIEALGRLTEVDGVVAIELPGGALLRLADNAQRRALLAAAVGPALVRVAGGVEGDSDRQHRPVTIALTGFEVVG